VLLTPQKQRTGLEFSADELSWVESGWNGMG